MEQIYTIPINEAFDAHIADPATGCPICQIAARLEDKELEFILGPAMMEPDIRIRTNKEGFCGEHYEKMIRKKNRLGLALILESHLAELGQDLRPGTLEAVFGKKNEKACRRIDRATGSCYVCGQISYHFNRTMNNLTELYGREKAFRDKFAAASTFCLPHAYALVTAAKRELTAKEAQALTDTVMGTVRKTLETLSEDVSWFCKKFDYRYADEPWKNSRDAVERAAAFLTGTYPESTGKKNNAPEKGTGNV